MAVLWRQWAGVIRRGALGVVGMAAMLFASAGNAQTITPVTWNVVGLDSNNVNVGPNTFPVGARVCNTTGSTVLANTWQVKFNWVTADPAPLITLSAPQVSVPELLVGACQDVFQWVTVKRDVAAYNARAQYNLSLVKTSDSSTLAQTPANREIYVEKLISQNRNAIDGYVVNGTSVTAGSATPVNVATGQTLDIVLNAHTATQGYEQLEKFLTLDPSFFRINKVTSTYTANAGTDPNAGNKLYADGCGWQNDLTVTTGPWQYHNNYSCSGTGKYGGTITLKLNVTVLDTAVGTSAVNALIYDFSGSSYHYNGDYGSGGLTFQIGTPATPTMADLAISKTTTGTGGSTAFQLTVTNKGPADAAGVVVTDTIPSGYTIDNNQGSGWPAVINGQTVTWTIGSLANAATATLSIKVVRKSNLNPSDYVNTATVTSTTLDPDTSNNSSSATIPASTAVADIQLTKVASNSRPLVGDSVTFTIKATNLGPDPATGVAVTDAIPAGYTVVSRTPSAGTLSGDVWSIGALALNATATLTVNATVNAAGPYLNTATVASTTTDPNTSNDMATASAEPTFLTITKTKVAGGNFVPNGSGSFDVVVTKTGNPDSLGTVTMSEVIPYGMTITSMGDYPPGSTWSCNTSTCTRTDAVGVGEYPTIRVNVALDSNPPTSMTNFASAYSSVGNSYAQATSPVALGADMKVTLSGFPVAVVHGGAVSGTVTCTNIGSTTATNASCDVSGLPAGASVTCNPTSPQTSLNAGASMVCSVSFTAPVSGKVTLTATTNSTGDSDASNNTAGAEVLVIVAVNDGTSNMTWASTGTTPYDLLSNDTVGGVAAVNGVNVSTPTLVSNGGLTGATISASGQLVVPNNTLPGTYTVTYQICSTAAPSVCDTATKTVVVQDPDMSVTVAGFPSTVAPGATVTGTVTCTNNGPLVANNATCSVSGLPAGAQVTCTPGSPQSTLAVGASIVCAVSYIAPATGAVTLVASTGADGDSNPANNTATAPVTVSAPPAPQAIPTLSEWGMMILSGLLAMVSVATLRRRQA